MPNNVEGLKEGTIRGDTTVTSVSGFQPTLQLISGTHDTIVDGGEAVESNLVNGFILVYTTNASGTDEKLRSKSRIGDGGLYGYADIKLYYDNLDEIISKIQIIDDFGRSWNIENDRFTGPLSDLKDIVYYGNVLSLRPDTGFDIRKTLRTPESAELTLVETGLESFELKFDNIRNLFEKKKATLVLETTGNEVAKDGYDINTYDINTLTDGQFMMYTTDSSGNVNLRYKSTIGNKFNGYTESRIYYKDLEERISNLQFLDKRGNLWSYFDSTFDVKLSVFTEDNRRMNIDDDKGFKEDDPNWRRNTDGNDCTWVAVAPERRCQEDIVDSNGTLSRIACKTTCDGYTDTYCAWVSDSGRRCQKNVRMNDGRLAQDACEEECVDYEKSYCEWVSQDAGKKVSKRWYDDRRYTCSRRLQRRMC